MGSDGTFIGGDLALSKGDEDEFEAEVTGAKPGVWLMSVETEESEDDEGNGFIGGIPKLLRFVWKGQGMVDYDALPRASTIQEIPAGTDPSADWEVVDSFSVDSGLACLFSKTALDHLLFMGPEEEREAMLETFMDDDGEGNVFVPGGIVSEYINFLLMSPICLMYCSVGE